jgi:ABC-type Na+ efflux pump permease subunit
MRDVIPAAVDFIEEHILDIILVVLLLFVMVIYIVLNNVKFPKSHPTLERVVVLENLENMDDDAEKKTSDKISEIETKIEKKSKYKKYLCGKFIRKR